MSGCALLVAENSNFRIRQTLWKLRWSWQLAVRQPSEGRRMTLATSTTATTCAEAAPPTYFVTVVKC
jgi:hypothetical protein